MQYKNGNLNYGKQWKKRGGRESMSCIKMIFYLVISVLA